MVQLSLLADQGAVYFDAHLEHMAKRARARGVSDRLVDRAQRATSARFEMWRGRSVGREEIVRAQSYFDAVVRRAILTSGDADARALRERLVAASIEADLRSVGWNRAKAAAEARRTLGVTASSAVA